MAENTPFYLNDSDIVLDSSELPSNIEDGSFTQRQVDLIMASNIDTSEEVISSSPFSDGLCMFVSNKDGVPFLLLEVTEGLEKISKWNLISLAQAIGMPNPLSYNNTELFKFCISNASSAKELYEKLNSYSVPSEL